MTTSAKILKKIKDEGIRYVDLRFTDLRGTLEHISYIASAVDKELLEKGVMFDGSSISGWKDINNSDMVILPDLSTAKADPFTAQPTLNILCDVIEPDTNDVYERDPRGVAKRAEAFLKESGIADTAYFGPEAEFFIFDDVQFAQSQDLCFYQIDSSESPENTGTEYDSGNLGHRPREGGGYFPVTPVDHSHDIRSEMLGALEAYGVEPEKHHHEVAPSQGEIGYKYESLTNSSDRLQDYKYVVKNVADAFNKTVTFMPKPIVGDNGSGMHCHISLWKDGKPLFAGDQYADLSQEALYFIGGILKHAKALNAFTNASTNSYKRLVPGYEAPVLLAYSARNRSAACRIPVVHNPKAKRVEIRFPDPTANGYLAFSALLMAGIDGIENEIDPGKAMNENLYALPPERLAKIPHVSRSLREAVEALKADHEFLLRGNVFNTELIEGYIGLKMEEVERYEMAPHPVEFDMYYST